MVIVLAMCQYNRCDPCNGNPMPFYLLNASQSSVLLATFNNLDSVCGKTVFLLEFIIKRLKAITFKLKISTIKVYEVLHMSYKFGVRIILLRLKDNTESRLKTEIQIVGVLSALSAQNKHIIIIIIE